MTVTVYLRDGTRQVIAGATTLKSEFLMSLTGFESNLVCRDHLGNVVAHFARDAVLGFRRSTPSPVESLPAFHAAAPSLARED